jgi:hypothetical protein
MMGILARLKEKCGIFNASIDLRREDVARIVTAHNAYDWFLYAFDKRAERWHVSEPCAWIARHLPRDSVVLETGCGCALNLIWLGQRGFSRLHGVDINLEALAAGKELSLLAGFDIQLREADCTGPAGATERIDVLLALNWTYHDDSFDLETFLLSYGRRIPPGGHVVIDVIDASYNDMAGNAYLSSDCDLPVEQRRPSEYRIRYSEQEVASAMEKAGFETVATFSRKQAVPVVVYIARKGNTP